PSQKALTYFKIIHPCRRHQPPWSVQLGPVSKSPFVASGAQGARRKAEEGVSLVWLSTDDNAARRPLGAAQPDSGTLRQALATGVFAEALNDPSVPGWSEAP
ncbi:hypothetical protein, partial [Actinoallomurus acaciae]